MPEVGSDSNLYPPTDKDKIAMLLVKSGVWDGDKGTPESQVKKLVDAMFAPGVTSEQRKQASQALNEVLGLQAPKALTAQDTRPDVWNKKILAGIDAQYGNGPDKLDIFWDAVQKKKLSLPDSNPLKTYESMSVNFEKILAKAQAKDREEFEPEVKKLAGAMFTPPVTPEQRQQASQAINEVLKLQPPKALTAQDAQQEWAKKIIAGINTQYGNRPDRLDLFLQAAEEKLQQGPNNPLKMYGGYPGSYSAGLKNAYDYLKVFNNIDPGKQDYLILAMDEKGNYLQALDAQGKPRYVPVKRPDGTTVLVPEPLGRKVSGQEVRDYLANFVGDSVAGLAHIYRLRHPGHPGDSLISVPDAQKMNGALSKELYGIENHTRSYPPVYDEILDSGETKKSQILTSMTESQRKAAIDNAGDKLVHAYKATLTFQKLQKNLFTGKPVSLNFPRGAQPDDMAFADLSADNIMLVNPENPGRDALATARDAARGAVTFTPQQNSPVLADAPVKADVSLPQYVTGGKDMESDNVRNSSYAAGPDTAKKQKLVG